MKVWKLWALGAFWALAACSPSDAVECTPKCMGDQTCVDGICQPITGPVGCVDSDACPAAGQVCVAGICQIPDPAACSSTCTGGSVCVDGACQMPGPAGCVDGDTCPVAAQVCVSGICQTPNPAACSSTCTGGSVCVEGECQMPGPAGCVDGNTCPVAAQVCVSGICQTPDPAACSSTCTSGSVCVDGACQMPDPAECSQGGECLEVCEGGICQTIQLVVSPNDLAFDLGAGTKTLLVSSNTAWSASCDRAWCSVTQSAAGGNGTVTVHVPGNENNEASRSANVQITAADGKLQSIVRVMQIGNEPIVRSFEPNAAPHGATLNLLGENFSPVLSNNNVSLNGVAARVLWASPDRLSVEVPQNKACTGPLQVRVNGRAATFLYGPYEFVYLLAAELATVADISAFGITTDAAGNLYVTNGYRIRRVTPQGVVSTLAGSSNGYAEGTGSNAQFSSPHGIARDTAGNLYVADSYNHRIRRVTPQGVVDTIAGSGTTGGEGSGYFDVPGDAAQFRYPRGITIDAQGNLYVADTDNHCIRRIDSGTLRMVTTLAGDCGMAGFNNGEGTDAQFRSPSGIILDAQGDLYVADTGNNRIRKLTLSNGVATVDTVVDGAGNEIVFGSPGNIAIDTKGNLYVVSTEYVSSGQILKMTPQGNQNRYSPSYYSPPYSSSMYSIATDGADNVYVGNYGGIYQVTAWEE